MNYVADELVARICRDANKGADGPPILDLARDHLDNSIWVCLPSQSLAQNAQRALAGFGIASSEKQAAKLHVTGWDIRLLRRRLAVVLAGVDDLSTEWDATVELAYYCYDRHLAAGDEPDPADVLAEVEATMRRAVPLPHRAPDVSATVDLLNLIDAAEDAYERLIHEHVSHAERALQRRAAIQAS